jgi:hypothetical protein
MKTRYFLYCVIAIVSISPRLFADELKFKGEVIGSYSVFNSGNHYRVVVKNKTSDPIMVRVSMYKRDGNASKSVFNKMKTVGPFKKIDFANVNVLCVSGSCVIKTSVSWFFEDFKNYKRYGATKAEMRALKKKLSFFNAEDSVNSKDLRFVKNVKSLPMFKETNFLYKYGVINKQFRWIAKPGLRGGYNKMAFRRGRSYLLKTVKAPLSHIVPVKVGKKYAYENTKIERLIIKPRFDHADRFYNGMARVKINGKIGYINLKGKLAVTPRFKNGGRFNEGTTWVETDRGYAYINTRGKILFTLQRGLVPRGPFYNGMAMVNKDGRFGFVNRQGRVAVKPVFLSARNFSNGVAVVVVFQKRRWDPDLYTHHYEDRFSYINKFGQLLLRPTRIRLGDFSRDGLAVVQNGTVSRDE